jgi:hypothetical protein
VALANEKWSYDQAGLTPAGAALLSIAVAVATSGMGSGVASTLGMGTTTTVAGVSTFTASAAGLSMNAAASAAISSLASQAAVAMVNNGGDIGKTLEQLGKEESIKNLLLTMATAGALDKLNQSLSYNGVSFSDINAKSTFGSQLLKNVTNNLASSAVDAAINGKPFNEDAISKALSSALVTTGMAQGANAIGDAATGKNGNPAQINAFTQAVAHAVLGCAGGAATAGNASGCAPGAVGGVVGELAAQYYNPSGDPAKTTDTVNFAKTMAAVAGVLVGGGGDNAQAVNIAATTGANAAQNNRQLHPDEIQWIKSNSSKFAKQLSMDLGREVSTQEAMVWLTAAGESDVDANAQRSNGMFVRGTSNTEEAQAYDAAKAFIAIGTKTNSGFIDANGQSQTLFTAKNGDFYKPQVYSEYRNDPQYRDYYWNVMGVNLKGDNMSPQEKAVYEQRQVIANKETVKQILTLGVQSLAGRVAVRAAALPALIAQERAKNEGVYQRIVDIPKGQKPDPSTYLSAQYIDAHLSDFRDSGVVRFTSENSLLARGTAGPDGGFVFPKNKFDSLFTQSGGDLSIIEKQLGLPSGYLKSADTVAIYIKPTDLKGLRMPSGNESGALPAEWIPGGYTKGGTPEAVIDFSHKPPITILFGGKQK